MYDAVGGENVGREDVGVVDAHWVKAGGHSVALECLRLETISEIGREHLRGENVVEEDVGELALVLREKERLEGALGKSREGSVGGREDGERTIAAKRVDEAGSGEGLYEGGEVVVLDSELNDGLGRLRRRKEDFIDNMYDAVGGEHVGRENVGVVDAHWVKAGSHSVALECLRLETISEIGREHLRGENVVEEDVGELVLVLREKERREGALGKSREGSVGGREDGERTIAAERVDEAGSGEGLEEDVEVIVLDSELNDGLGRLRRRKEDCVDNMYDAVGGEHVGREDVGVVDAHWVKAGGHSVALECLRLETISEIGREHLRGENVVEEDVGELV